MLSKKVLHYLEENEEPLLPEYQEKNRAFLLKNGFDEKSAFFQFMVKYSDEMLSTEGHLSDVMGDLMDYTESSFNYQVHMADKVPVHYISLTDDTRELYLLYNKLTGEVVLVENADINKLNNHKFDRHWKTFNDFLEEFFQVEE